MRVKVLRFLIQAEGEYPALIRQPWQLRRQHIRPASASQEMCEGASRGRSPSSLTALANRFPIQLAPLDGSCHRKRATSSKSYRGDRTKIFSGSP